MGITRDLHNFLVLVDGIEEGPSSPTAVKAREPVLTAWKCLCESLRSIDECESALLLAAHDRRVLICAWPNQSVTCAVLSSLILAQDRLRPHGEHLESERSRLLLSFAASLGDMCAQDALNSMLPFDSNKSFTVSVDKLTKRAAEQLLNKLSDGRFDEHLANTLHHYGMLIRTYGGNTHIDLWTAALDLKANASVHAARDLAHAYAVLTDETRSRLHKCDDPTVQVIMALGQFPFTNKLKTRRRLIARALKVVDDIHEGSVGRLCLGHLCRLIAVHMRVLGENTHRMHSRAMSFDNISTIHDTPKVEPTLSMWAPHTLGCLMCQGLDETKSKAELQTMLDPWLHYEHIARVFGDTYANNSCRQILNSLLDIATTDLHSCQ